MQRFLSYEATKQLETALLKPLLFSSAVEVVLKENRFFSRLSQYPFQIVSILVYSEAFPVLFERADCMLTFWSYVTYEG